MIRVEVIDYGNTCGAIRHAGTAITRRAKAAAGICITARAASPVSPASAMMSLMIIRLNLLSLGKFSRASMLITSSVVDGS
jgi:hypothetical protein